MDYGKIAVSVVEKYKPGQDIRQCWECELVGVTDKEASIKKAAHYQHSWGFVKTDI
ncbi:hypothetical protein [Dickeya oryzae]|uniref:Uncharacterized protein n=1 Tax=Dickeya oryzae TaxID=1240404 RepID=A0AB39IV90_9GAMM|nr:hypothetical protein [Dickeya oryzae]MCA6989465.1 hypothetical protein [Dickeya oryzae]